MAAADAAGTAADGAGMVTIDLKSSPATFWGYLAPTNSRLCCSRLAAQFFEQLRSDQHQVLELVVTGLLNKQIADKLGTCETTLQIHRGHVMRKCVPDR